MEKILKTILNEDCARNVGLWEEPCRGDLQIFDCLIQGRVEKRQW